MVDQFILMADVVDSGSKEPVSLASNLKAIVSDTNKAMRQNITSPLTITLGDEFQGVCGSLKSSIEVVLKLERKILSDRGFYLRYVIYEGIIETPVNVETSYGMLGEGLTKARRLLNQKSGARPNLQCKLKDIRTEKLLNYVFEILLSYREISAAKNHPEILDMLLFDQISDREISEKVSKTRSEIWKFRQNWQMNIYVSALNILREELY